MIKSKLTSFFARCIQCDRIFRAATAYHGACRACRSERELAVFFEWLDVKLA